MSDAPTKPYSVPLHVRLNRVLLLGAFRALARVLLRVRRVGWENIPKSGAYVIAYNHVSILEPPLLAAFWPKPPEAVAALDVFFRPWQAHLVKLYGALPVRRHEVDRRVLSAMEAVLRAGMPLLIAPEGGRSHVPGLRRGWPGVVQVLDRLGSIPIVPVGLTGTSDAHLRDALRFKRPEVVIRVGKPFTLPPLPPKGAERRAARRRYIDFVMCRIADLLPPEYRGVYAECPEFANLQAPLR